MVLPGGVRRFFPGKIGGNQWGQCGHGLSCRPKERWLPEVLDSLSVLFGYYGGSSDRLIQGTKKLRYCKRPFALLIPSWKLLANGEISQLVFGWFSASGLLPVGLAGGAGGPGAG